MPLHSMTGYGYGHAESACPGSQIVCEIRTLNSRFLEVNVRLPRAYMALEPEIQATVKSALGRGKVDIYLDFLAGLKQSRVPSQGYLKPPASSAHIDETGCVELPVLNLAAVRHYAQQLATAQLAFSEAYAAALPGETDSNPAALLPIPALSALSDLWTLEGVCVNASSLGLGDSGNPSELKARHRPGVQAALAEALKTLMASREGEGTALGKGMATILAELGAASAMIEAKAAELQDQIYTTYRKRLTNLLERLHQRDDIGLLANTTAGTVHKASMEPRLLDGNLQTTSRLFATAVSGLPDERLLTEIALLTDKSDIAEEVHRLRTHEAEFARLMMNGGGVGRKLDFLCQEMHREVNTMSSKLLNTETASILMGMKQAVERLRQQVQNIE